MKESRYYFIIAIIIVILIASGCKDEVGSTTNLDLDPAKMPTMVSHNVQTLLSDSGTTRYRITTKTWLAYENREDPHWIFPDGLIAEELENDANFNVKMSMKCDSAYYDEEKRLWSLNSMVTITKSDGSKIETNQMYWDRKANKYYSDSFIRMQQADKILEGHGYVSNDDMTNYTVRKVQAIVPVNDTKFPSM